MRFSHPKVKHTDQCRDKFIQFVADKLEYVINFPNYCRKCNGYGGTTYSYDPSPSGVGLGSGQVHDVVLCEACAENGFCSQCLYTIDTSSDDPCPNCGWEWGQGLPEEPECWCHEERLTDELLEGLNEDTTPLRETDQNDG